MGVNIEEKCPCVFSILFVILSPDEIGANVSQGGGDENYHLAPRHIASLRMTN